MKRRAQQVLTAFALIGVHVAFCSEAARVDAIVEQPRSFGYVIGDIATQRVLLENQGHAFTPDALPTAGSFGNWLERRAVRIESDGRGRRWLVVDYQIMNSPQTLTAVTLPAWKLASKSGKTELSIGEWSLSVAPLTPRQPFARVGLGELRPDRGATLIDLAPLRRWIAIWLVCLVVVASSWVAWWISRNWRASASQPFAKALRELRQIDERSPQAWHVLHRAFDGTAGRVVQAETLPAMFERAPHFEARRAAIEQFFAQSAARFFGAQAASHATAAAPGLSVRALCIELRRIEKRHET